MNTAHLAELKEAWTLRNSQNLDLAESALRKLVAYGITEDGWNQELKILEASLLRGRKRVEESGKILVHMKEKIEEHNLPVPFSILPTTRFEFVLSRLLSLSLRVLRSAAKS